MNKGFWVAKNTGGDPSFDDPSRMEAKRSHQWFLDAAEPELFPNKKQAVHVQTPNSTSCSGISDANVHSWDSTSGFEVAPNQFTHRLFGPETHRCVNIAERSECPVGTGQAFNRDKDSSFISSGQTYDKDDDCVMFMGHAYNGRGDARIGSIGSAYMKGDECSISVSDTYSKEETNMISFGGLHEANDIIPGGTAIGSYGQSYDQSSAAVQAQGAVFEKELDSSNSNGVEGNRAAKLKPEPISKNKIESKATKKDAPHSFPSNVRSLISTGMLDGVPVKYVSLSREELRGVIKGSGYLCGCESCNFSKVLNAYEFERHSGCKTKHPNNHIYFENGKTIYQIVQELRSTHESMLFDVIQTVFGAPINQRSFRIWKESFQAATRELQRIYGKEELNL